MGRLYSFVIAGCAALGSGAVAVLNGSLSGSPLGRLEGPLVEALAPEVLGLALDGIIFVAILGMFELRRLKRRRLDRRLAMARVARRVFMDITDWLQDHKRDSDNPVENLEILGARIASKDPYAEFDNETEERLRAFIYPQLATLRALLPSAAEVSEQFLDEMMNTINHLQDAVDAATAQKRIYYYSCFIQSVKSFFRASALFGRGLSDLIPEGE
jgi:hypothetical protein